MSMSALFIKESCHKTCCIHLFSLNFHAASNVFSSFIILRTSQFVLCSVLCNFYHSYPNLHFSRLQSVDCFFMMMMIKFSPPYKRDLSFEYFYRLLFQKRAQAFLQKFASVILLIFGGYFASHCRME